MDAVVLVPWRVDGLVTLNPTRALCVRSVEIARDREPRLVMTRILPQETVAPLPVQLKAGTLVPTQPTPNLCVPRNVETDSLTQESNVMMEIPMLEMGAQPLVQLRLDGYVTTRTCQVHVLPSVETAP